MMTRRSQEILTTRDGHPLPDLPIGDPTTEPAQTLVRHCGKRNGYRVIDGDENTVDVAA
jgi:hypothetical protein